MSWQERIEQPPDVLGGQPVVRDTRVPVRVWVGGLAGGMTIEEVCASYRVTPEDVRAAVSYTVEALGRGAERLNLAAHRVVWTRKAGPRALEIGNALAIGVELYYPSARWVRLDVRSLSFCP
jgi:uncharacterized protein (DUF433 family)